MPQSLVIIKKIARDGDFLVPNLQQCPPLAGFFYESPDYMPPFKWITSGSDACFACTRWNGKIFKDLKEVPDLPVHPNCQCRIQLISSLQNQQLNEIGRALTQLKEKSSQDLFDLSRLALIPAMFERLVEAARSLYSDVEQAVKTLDVFWNNYTAMREANFKGADDYFHSKANAEAAQLGETGEKVAKFISDTREFVDYYNNLHLKKRSLQATIEDAAKDQRANIFGREQGRKNPDTVARDLIESLRPKGLDERY